MKETICEYVRLNAKELKMAAAAVDGFKVCRAGET